MKTRRVSYELYQSVMRQARLTRRMYDRLIPDKKETVNPFFKMEEPKMLPMQAVRLRLGTLLSTDTTTLDQSADANVIALVMGPFVNVEDLVIGSLTLATFTGATPIAAVLGAQQVGVDPATGNQVITIVPPSGGWRWQTTDGANLPQTIYGYALVTNGLATLLAAERLTTPITLSTAGEEINLGEVDITISVTPTV